MKPIIIILFTLLLSQIAKAQSCTGSVGDPMVDITFGAGEASVGSPLPAQTTTNLSYWYFDCPNDGQYTITNRTTSCFNGTWHSTKDHTGNANGYFMLINASYEPSSFYVQEINGLCAGTQYQFAVWITNMCNFNSSIRPSIRFTIEKTDGTILGKYETGEIPISLSPVWKQYGMNFNTPEGVSTVVLRMRNNSSGGIGNDLGLDDITFRPVGPSIAVNSPDFTGDTTLLCSTETKTVRFQSNVEQCYSTTAYQWQVSTDSGASWSDISGATSTVYDRTPTPAGTYLYRIAAAQKGNVDIATCRVTSKPYTVIVYEPDSRTIRITEPEGAVCESSPVTFIAKTTFAGKTPSFQWMRNSEAVGSNDSIYTTTSLSSQDKVSCIFTSSLSCNSPATSNTVSVTIIQKARSTIERFICEGESYEGYIKSGIYTNVFAGSNGCDSIRTLNLTVYPKQHTVFDTTICFGTSYLGLNKEGSYDYTYTSVNGCDSIHTIVLHVMPDIYAKPFSNRILCTGSSIALSPDIPFDTYLWQDGSKNSTFTAFHGGTYKVTATNKCGTATKTIAVEEKICIVAFPTAFTPNGDNKNDVFRVVNGYDIARYHCVIYNRWGQKVFESFDPAKGWNGYVNARRSENGTYLWFCDYEGKSKPGPVHLKGTVVLIR